MSLQGQRSEDSRKRENNFSPLTPTSQNPFRACTPSLSHTLAHSYTLLHTLAHSYTLLHTLAHSCTLLHTLTYSCILLYFQHRWVEGSNLMVCGSYIYNHYVDCRDTNYYLSSDKINDSLCLPPDPAKQLSPVLACQDCSLRVLRVCNVTFHTPSLLIAIPEQTPLK